MPKAPSEKKPCGCNLPVRFEESDEGVVTVNCLECAAAWPLKEWLSVTTALIQRTEAARLGRPLTPRESHGIEDQCYFRTIPRGGTGLTGDPEVDFGA